VIGKKTIEALVKGDGTNFSYGNVLDVVATGMNASDTYCSSFYLVRTDVTRDSIWSLYKFRWILMKLLNIIWHLISLYLLVEDAT
jgi:hypothetical protein